MLKRLLPKLNSDTLAQSVVVAMLLTIVCRLVAFARGVVLVRTLDSGDLGTWALMTNAVQVLAFFLAIGIPSGISRYAEGHRSAGTLRSFFAKTLIRSLAIAAVVCLLGIAFWKPLGQTLFSQPSDFPLVAITLAAILATVAFSVMQGMLHGLRMFRLNSLVELFHNAAFLGLVVLLLFSWQSDVFAAAYAHLIVTGLVALLVGFWVFRAIGASTASSEEKPYRPGATWWTLAIFSLGAWSAGSLQALWRCLDRYMLLHLGDMSHESALDQIGQYFIASKLGQPLSALAGLLAVILVPHVARLWENRQRRQAGRLIVQLSKVSMLGMLLVGAMLVICKPLLFAIVAGKTPFYANAVFSLVLVTIIAVAFQAIVRSYLLCKERTWLIGGVWLAALAVNAVLNVLLIPRYQLVGAAIATGGSAMFAAAAILWLSIHNGMRNDRRLWLLLPAPAMLLLPIPSMLAVLITYLIMAAGTGWIFTAREKRIILRWCQQRWRTYFFPGKRGSRALVLNSR